MSRLTAVIATLLGVLVCLSSLGAQQRVVIQLNVNNDGEEQFESLMNDLRDTAEFHLSSRLQLINQTCELTDDQLKRLNVASKGAVAKFLTIETERSLKLLRRYQQQAGFDIEKLENKEEGGDDKTGEDDEEDDDEPQIRNFAFSLQTAFARDIEKQERWQRSLKTVLTEEQKENLETALADRNDRVRNAAVDRFIAKIDSYLFLAEAQRPKVREAIFEKFGDLLVKEIIFEDQYRRPTMQANQIDRDPQYAELVKGVLTEPQIRQWTRNVEPHLRYLETLKNRR